MKRQKTRIINKLGLHARASAKLVSLASSFKSEVTLTRDGQQVNAKSIMGIMMLAAGPGTEVEVCTSGRDEAEALTALVDLIQDRFGEEQ